MSYSPLFPQDPNTVPDGSASLTLSFSGVIPAMDVKVTVSLVNNIVTLSVPPFSATSAGGADTIVSTAVPSGFRPQSIQNWSIMVLDDTASALGIMFIDTAGVITIGKGLLPTPNFTGGGAATGLTYGTTVSFPIV